MPCLLATAGFERKRPSTKLDSPCYILHFNSRVGIMRTSMLALAETKHLMNSLADPVKNIRSAVGPGHRSGILRVLFSHTDVPRTRKRALRGGPPRENGIFGMPRRNTPWSWGKFLIRSWESFTSTVFYLLREMGTFRSWPHWTYKKQLKIVLVN